MKRTSSSLLSPLSEGTVINLTTEVKEILATGLKKSPNRMLSTADLWNIQRRQKARVARRYF
jgi:hypothetical protein